MRDAWSRYASLAATPAAPLRVLTTAELLAQPLRRYLLKGVLSSAELSIWWGPPKSGKSFLLMHVAYALAQGRSVFGRRVHTTRVLYLACEGRSGLRGRIEALIGAHGETENFLVIAQPVDLWGEGDTTDALATIVQRESIGLVVVDTLNRVMAGGDENASHDMGVVIANLDRLRAETGAHVAVVHHGTKNGGGGPRGHGSLAGAADALIEVTETEDGARAASLAHAKDDAAGDGMQFRLRVVELGADADGDPRTTCLVDETAGGELPSRRRAARLNEEAVTLLRAIEDAIASGDGRDASPELGMPVCPTMNRAVLKGILIRGGWLLLPEALPALPGSENKAGSVSDSEHKRLYKRLTHLKAKGIIGFNKEDVWLTKAPLVR